MNRLALSWTRVSPLRRLLIPVFTVVAIAVPSVQRWTCETTE